MMQELLIVLALILANGFFSGAEMAIVASRRGRLRQLAEEGDAPARAALELASSPDRFLPTVQIGITLVGTSISAMTLPFLTTQFIAEFGWRSSFALLSLLPLPLP